MAPFAMVLGAQGWSSESDLPRVLTAQKVHYGRRSRRTGLGAGFQARARNATRGHPRHRASLGAAARRRRTEQKRGLREDLWTLSTEQIKATCRLICDVD